jgi:drug/metabolite transporter (DMT)-like permease
MMLAMLWFVGLDTLAKYLMQDYPLVQVVWARFFFHIVIVSALLGRRLPRVARSRAPGYQVLRSVLMLATTSLFFTGLQFLPLATAATLMFLSPIFVTVLAIPLLGEQVGVRRWAGIMTGFVGALIVVRPGITEVEWSMLIVIGAALSHALYQILTRGVRADDGPMTSLVYTGLAGAVVMSVLMPYYWQPVPAPSWLLFFGLGIAGCVGHLCFIRSFQCAPASLVAPFSYTTLVWATLFGYVLFFELPDRWTLAGASLIMLAGLYIFYRERTSGTQSGN